MDDLKFALRDLKAIIILIKEKYTYKLKGTCSISYHLSSDLFRDSDVTLRMAQKTYI